MKPDPATTIFWSPERLREVAVGGGQDRGDAVVAEVGSRSGVGVGVEAAVGVVAGDCEPAAEVLVADHDDLAVGLDRHVVGAVDARCEARHQLAADREGSVQIAGSAVGHGGPERQRQHRRHGCRRENPPPEVP